MRRTFLSAEVQTPAFEHELAVPANTTRMELISSGFPVFVSFVQGEVAATPRRGFVIGQTRHLIRHLGQFQGPIYFASDQPHAILLVAAWQGGAAALFSPSGGGFGQDAFDSSFDI